MRTRLPPSSCDLPLNSACLLACLHAASSLLEGITEAFSNSEDIASLYLYLLVTRIAHQIKHASKQSETKQIQSSLCKIDYSSMLTPTINRHPPILPFFFIYTKKFDSISNANRQSPIAMPNGYPISQFHLNQYTHHSSQLPSHCASCTRYIFSTPCQKIHSKSAHHLRTFSILTSNNPAVACPFASSK